MDQRSAIGGGRSGLPQRIEAAVRDASTIEIALALPPGNELREEAWIAHRVALGIEYFPCPACQADTPPAWPWARVVNPVEWRCDLCGALGTRWELVRLVLESPMALRRFLAHRRADNVLRRLDLEEVDS